MSDQTPVVPEPTATPPAADATPPPATTPADEFDRDRAMATIHAQREKEKQLKAELAEAKKAADRLAEIEAAQMTEQEKAVKRAEEAEKLAAAAMEQMRTGLLLAELAKPEHGIVDAEAAAALITGVEYDDHGRPTNATDRITALLEAKGFLKATGAAAATVAKPTINSGAGTTPAPGPNLLPEEVQMAEKLGMSPERYAALKEVRNAADYQKLSDQAAAAQ